MLHWTSLGLSALMAAYDRPHLSSVPGLKLSITTSATPASAITASRPAADLRSTAQLRLLRLTERKYELSPLTNGGPYRRLSSPIRGSSILTTSAPRSPRCIVANGPETTRHRSRILMPERASVLDDRIRQILHRQIGRAHV